MRAASGNRPRHTCQPSPSCAGVVLFEPNGKLHPSFAEFRDGSSYRFLSKRNGKIDLNRSKTPRILGKFLTSRRVSAPVGESVPFEHTCSPVLCDHSATLRLGRSDLTIQTLTRKKHACSADARHGRARYARAGHGSRHCRAAHHSQRYAPPRRQRPVWARRGQGRPEKRVPDRGMPRCACVCMRTSCMGWEVVEWGGTGIPIPVCWGFDGRSCPGIAARENSEQSEVSAHGILQMREQTPRHILHKLPHMRACFAQLAMWRGPGTSLALTMRFFPCSQRETESWEYWPGMCTEIHLHSPAPVPSTTKTQTRI